MNIKDIEALKGILTKEQIKILKQKRVIKTTKEKEIKRTPKELIDIIMEGVTDKCDTFCKEKVYNESICVKCPANKLIDDTETADRNSLYFNLVSYAKYVNGNLGVDVARYLAEILIKEHDTFKDYNLKVYIGFRG